MQTHNPTRRNRNIGTSKSGHGQNNRMTLPQLAHGSHAFWERIETSREGTRVVSGRVLKFFVRPTRADCTHACTIDDIAHLISFVPLSEREGMKAIVLRQPRRKEEVLALVWGRLSYSAELVNGRGYAIYAGPAIMVAAVNPSEPLKFGRSLSGHGATELERLRSDGGELRRGDKNHTLDLSLQSCRPSPWCRDILHDLGHWVDFLEKVEGPTAVDAATDYGPVPSATIAVQLAKRNTLHPPMRQVAEASYRGRSHPTCPQVGLSTALRGRTTVARFQFYWSILPSML